VIDEFEYVVELAYINREQRVSVIFELDSVDSLGLGLDESQRTVLQCWWASCVSVADEQLL